MIFNYFDPGLGAMIVQALVAAGAAIALFSKTAMHKIKSILGINKNDDLYDDIDIENDNEDDQSSRKN